MSENYFVELNNINVNGKTEKKNGLTYLSWAWAWGEVKKLHPDATYTIYENADGLFYHTDGKTCWVKTGVTVNGVEHIEYLPVMDFKNRSIPVEQVTSFDVNKAIQRSLTKAVARHGLGLYIYAGEDLPESEAPEEKPTAVPAPKCADCGGMLYPIKKRDGTMWSVSDMAEYSLRRFDRILCPDCQKKAFNMEKLEEQAQALNHEDAGDRL
jgi:hypothetical protein|nr:MAG TPA: Protein of unknown function (DUF1071) [Caudoviricetes sp.]